MGRAEQLKKKNAELEERLKVGKEEIHSTRPWLMFQNFSAWHLVLTKSIDRIIDDIRTSAYSGIARCGWQPVIGCVASPWNPQPVLAAALAVWQCSVQLSAGCR